MRAWYNERPAWLRANESGHIELVRDFCFFIDKGGITTAYWVPSGYVCDGASIPRPAWSIVGSPFDPMNAEFAWVHDPLYLTHAVSRSEADEALYQIGLQSGNGIMNMKTKWGAVRAFAGFAWNNSSGDRDELMRLRILISQRPDRDKFISLWGAMAA